MMDYRYIHQLLERYFRCEATLGEEAVLRAFFAQEAVPADLASLAPLFTAPAEERSRVSLSDEVSQRILDALTGDAPVRARTITLSQRLRPLWRAAASVAVLLTLGMAAEMSLEPTDAPYPGQVSAGKMVRHGARVAKGDSLKADTTAIPSPAALVK